jgi:hypothetical protein
MEMGIVEWYSDTCLRSFSLVGAVTKQTVQTSSLGGDDIFFGDFGKVGMVG